ncbi:MAG: hypothetical protein MJ181_03465 [Treponema sp.]|nr:hypothetical protein [Treponema sp.]
MINNIQTNRGGRNGGIELLRILCMFGFVCLHVIGYSSIAPFGNQNPQSWFLLHLRYLLNVGVDVFAFISGYYGIRFSIRKFLNLLYIGIFSSVIVFFAEIYFFDVDLRIINLVQIFLNNWYFREYLILFLLSPFINIYLEQTKKENLEKMILPLVFIFIWNFLATQLPSSFGQTDSLGNHSAMLLITIYILGRILNKTGCLEKINTGVLVVTLMICFPVLFYVSRLKDFSSPFCILAAISLFELFRRLPVNARVTNVACFLSPSMLGILILHNAGSNQISGGLVHRYFDTYECNLSGLAFLKYAINIFFIALFIDFVRRLTVFLIVRIIRIRKKDN